MQYDIFSGEHEEFRRQLKKFFAEKVAPFRDEWDKNRQIPRSIWNEMGKMGFLGFCYDPEYGGLGVDVLFRIVMAEELALSGNAAFGVAVAAHNDMSTTYINLLGTHEQKKKWLSPCITGDKVCAIAVSEPGAGSDVAAIKTRAEKKGDKYIINGQKTFITNGYYGDYLVTAVKTDMSADPPFKGISLMLIERDRNGVTARKLEKIGAHSTDTSEIFLEDVEVPAENLLGQEGQGFYAIMQNFQMERLIAGVLCVELAQYVLDKTIQYTKEREAFGRPISKFQVVKHKLVDMATAVEMNRAFGYQCAVQYSKGRDVTKEISMFKAEAAEMINRVVYDATQLHGGYGYMYEYEVARLYPDLRGVSIAGGTTEIMKEIIARYMGI